MMKKIWAAVCAAAMLMTGAALAETDVRVTALKGPTAMGMVELMNEAESGAVNGNAYDFTIASAVDEVSPKLVKGETDIAAVPANLAAVLYNNTEGQVEVLAVNTLGVLYIVESGDSIVQRGGPARQDDLRQRQGRDAGICAELHPHRERHRSGEGRDDRVEERARRVSGRADGRGQRDCDAAPAVCDHRADQERHRSRCALT